MRLVKAGIYTINMDKVSYFWEVNGCIGIYFDSSISHFMLDEKDSAEFLLNLDMLYTRDAK